jgi:hypothetical protein
MNQAWCRGRRGTGIGDKEKRMDQEVVEWQKRGRRGIGNDGEEEKEQEVA